MTHNIIHDEDRIQEIINQHDKLRGIRIIEDVMKQYAEHYLIKHIDSEIERLGGLKKDILKEEAPVNAEDWELHVGKVCGNNYFITDQITHLMTLKAELTKSK